MLKREQMQPEFEAFGVLWKLWKYQDELSKSLTEEEEDRIWTEIINLTNSVEKIIEKSKDKEKTETFVKMAINTIDYLNALYKKNRTIA